MKQIVKEYNVEQYVMTLFCDNLFEISVSKNPVQHSRTNHIDIRHHFIKDLVEDKVVNLEHMPTDKQLDDIFTKPLDGVHFENFKKFTWSVHIGEPIVVKYWKTCKET